MKNIFDAPFLEEMRKTCANMYRLGWDERNGGNVSYMLDENELKKGSFYVVAVPTPINEEKNPDFKFIKSASSSSKEFPTHKCVRIQFLIRRMRLQ